MMKNVAKSLIARVQHARGNSVSQCRARLVVEQLEGRNLLTSFSGFAINAGPMDFDLGFNHHETHHEATTLTTPFNAGFQANERSRDAAGTNRGRPDSQSRNGERDAFEKRSEPNDGQAQLEGRKTSISHARGGSGERAPLSTAARQPVETVSLSIPMLRPDVIDSAIPTPDVRSSPTSSRTDIQLTPTSIQSSGTLRSASPTSTLISNSRDVAQVSFRSDRSVSQSVETKQDVTNTVSVREVSTVSDVLPFMETPATEADVAAAEADTASIGTDVDRFGGVVDLVTRRESQSEWSANGPTVPLDIELATHAADDSDVIEELMQLDLFVSEVDDNTVSEDKTEGPTDNDVIRPSNIGESTEQATSSSEASSNDAVFAAWEAVDDCGGLVDIQCHSDTAHNDHSIGVTWAELLRIDLKPEPTVGEAHVFEFLDADFSPEAIPVSQPVENYRHIEPSPITASENGSITHTAMIASPLVVAAIYRKRIRERTTRRQDRSAREPVGQRTHTFRQASR